jgi:hypothetical protein
VSNHQRAVGDWTVRSHTVLSNNRWTKESRILNDEGLPARSLTRFPLQEFLEDIAFEGNIVFPQNGVVQTFLLLVDTKC